MKQSRFLYYFNDRQHFRRFLYGLIFLALFTGVGAVFNTPAWAASFACSNGTPNGNLFDQDTIGTQVTDQNGNSYTINTSTTTTNGDPFGSACPQTLGIFGRIICFFKSVIGQVVSSMYCGFQNTLIGPFSIAMELFIVVSGIAIMTGITQLTVREGMVALIKIALVWAFAMNASWGIGIAYTLFMGLAEEGSIIVLGAVGGSGGSGAGAYLTQPDSVLGGMLSLITTGAGGGSGFANVPPNCMLWLVGFLLALLFFMPWIAMLIISLIVQYFWLYARALLGYLTALVLIGFLFILAPLFISFALFKITRPMFEQWLQYLTSFSLQMIIVFAFLALLNLIPVGAFFKEVLGLLREVNSTEKHFFFGVPVHFCSICTYTLNATANITDSPPPVTCDSTGNIIGLSQLFTAQDLVVVIASQAIALWIVGNVMQDFMKEAPSIARDLTGNLPFAATLGGEDTRGTTGGNSGIEYLGLDDAEAGIQKFIDKADENLSGSNPSTLARLGVVGTVAGAAYEALKGNYHGEHLVSGIDDVLDKKSDAPSGKAKGGNPMLTPPSAPSGGVGQNLLTVPRPSLDASPALRPNNTSTQTAQAKNTIQNTSSQEGDEEI